MKAFYSILLVAVWAAGFCSAGRRKLGIDTDFESSCGDKCHKDKACMKLEKMKPKKKVEKCSDFIYDTCEDADDVTKCLAAHAASTKGGCNKRISRFAVRCMTCEFRCYEIHGNDDDAMPGYGEDSDGYGSDSESDDDDEEECLAECQETRACKFVAKLSDKKKSGCSQFADQYCDDEVSVSCFMATKKQADARCPFGVRNKALACWRCEERCDSEEDDDDDDHDDDDDDDDDVDGYDDENDDDDDDEHDEVESACHADCADSTSCRNFDASKDANLQYCKALAMANCNYDFGEGDYECDYMENDNVDPGLSLEDILDDNKITIAMRRPHERKFSF